MKKTFPIELTLPERKNSLSPKRVNHTNKKTKKSKEMGRKHFLLLLNKLTIIYYCLLLLIAITIIKASHYFKYKRINENTQSPKPCNAWPDLMSSLAQLPLRILMQNQCETKQVFAHMKNTQTKIISRRNL